MSTQFDVKVEIDAEAVQAQIVKAIVDGAIGEHILQSVNDLLVKSHSWTDNLVTVAVKSGVDKIVREEIFKILNQQRELINKLITERLTENMISNAIDRLIKHSLED